jgi:hypothetical protein
MPITSHQVSIENNLLAYITAINYLCILDLENEQELLETLFEKSGSFKLNNRVLKSNRLTYLYLKYKYPDSGFAEKYNDFYEDEMIDEQNNQFGGFKLSHVKIS